MLFPKIHKCCPSQIFEQGTEYDFEIYLTTGMSFSGNIEGIITDSYSNPIEGVQIESEGYYACNPAECTSDSEGHYSIMQESSNKSIIVRANADGYEVAEAGVSLREGGNVTRNFTLVREDECPDDLEKTEPGVCGCDVPDTDIDNDEKLDCEDNCPGTYNPDQADTDGDKIAAARMIRKKTNPVYAAAVFLTQTLTMTKNWIVRTTALAPTTLTRPTLTETKSLTVTDSEMLVTTVPISAMRIRPTLTGTKPEMPAIAARMIRQRLIRVSSAAAIPRRTLTETGFPTIWTTVPIFPTRSRKTQTATGSGICVTTA